MLNAGGGPLEVSIPWLLRDAGGRRVAGERGSMPVAAGWCAKYPVGGDSGVDRGLDDDGGDTGDLLAWPSDTIPVVGVGFAVGVGFWVACKVAFTADDDGSVVVAKASDWPVPPVKEESVPRLFPGRF